MKRSYRPGAPERTVPATLRPVEVFENVRDASLLEVTLRVTMLRYIPDLENN
jgi:hypothetical protein